MIWVFCLFFVIALVVMFHRISSAINDGFDDYDDEVIDEPR